MPKKAQNDKSYRDHRGQYIRGGGGGYKTSDATCM